MLHYNAEETKKSKLIKKKYTKIEMNEQILENTTIRTEQRGKGRKK